jgi:HSP20 family protein
MTTGTALAPKKAIRDLMTIDPFTLFQNRINRLFGELTPMLEETLPLTTWTPLCDIYETKKEVVLKMELPGLKKEDVKVSIENDVLQIFGERKFEEEIKKENFHRIELNYGDFLRRFTLPTYVDPAKISAEFKDGLLMIVLPKREEAKTKLVEVKVK